MPRRSGRYPWGSGDDPYQRDNSDFLGRIEELKKSGWTENAENVRKEFGCSLNQYRTRKTVARAERDNYNRARVNSMKGDGLNRSQIARKLGVSESTIRGWEEEKHIANVEQARKTANFIKDRVDKTGKYIDVGKGVPEEVGVSKERMAAALKLLKEEGYEVWGGRFDQTTNSTQKTTFKLVCPPGTPHKDIFDNPDKIDSLKEYKSHDGGDTFKKLSYPKSIDSKRVKVLLRDEVGPDGETGLDKDGLIQIRRGVEDLSLGDSRIAQVRILVDDSKYLKGMAVYSDNIPEGYDILFNSSKKTVEDSYKPIKDDPDNPFGSLIKENGQSYYIDKDGKEQLSAINKTREEGDWSEWKDAAPAQFLSKQTPYLAKKQLDLAIEDKQAEFDRYCSLENPTVKKYYLDKFAESCDSASVDLQAAALPGQKHHVIIPINTLKDNEIYAPGYDDGTKLALVRYPHGGTFEIPILTVNNKNETAKRVIPADVMDAVGINKEVADRLSGADFDGDTAMVIPTHDKHGNVKITSTDRLKDLIDFDPKTAYPEVKGMVYMSKKNMQREMGIISNLITDMTLKGANGDELAAATKHSMVIIDAYKHKLNYKLSEVQNNIKALKQTYQIHRDEFGNIIKTGGVSTLISAAKGETTTIKTKGQPKPNIKGEDWYDPNRPEGALIYTPADNLYYPDKQYNEKTGLTTVRTVSGKKVTYNAKDPAEREKYNPIEVVDKDGSVRFTNKAGDIEYVVKTKTKKSTHMAETDDARTLISDYNTKMEQLYADYANAMKAMANKARVESWNTKEIEESKSAKLAYKEEVESLNAKLTLARLNHPRERLANIRANVIVDKKIADAEKKGNQLTKEEIKKAKQQALEKTRLEVGAIKRRDREIPISDKEWEAIQAGAIGHTRLKEILNNSNPDILRDRAMPTNNKKYTLNASKINRVKSLSTRGYTIEQIARKLGVSKSTVSKYLKGEN